MPTKRRFILFIIVLALMLLIKRAVGQEPTVGWDRDRVCFPELGIGQQAVAAWIFGVFFGAIFGGIRARLSSALARDSDLIQLGLLHE